MLLEQSKDDLLQFFHVGLMFLFLVSLEDLFADEDLLAVLTLKSGSAVMVPLDLLPADSLLQSKNFHCGSLPAEACH